VTPVPAGEIVGLNVKPDPVPKQMVVSFGKLTLRFEVVKTGTIVSTTTQQFTGLETVTKRGFVLFAVIVFPVVPFDQRNVGLLMAGALTVITDDEQEEF
jgi:hypothetical protein